ncbi:high-temperature-induced dauer-formation protein-domain-containing protein [Phakopsora pachyrhizi]|uniref:High-temperature-induced dauer-formation protein-domain-containing protein n=1 Tax=Phakopsora pachyrhizi TaxID=170000 RepID=A0AAV0ALV3_PHAPC|nr:high-temperature-induced dauer-formation protein-domain-containing protein [Phakopsora pachyrhizi]
MASVLDFAKKNLGLAPDPKLHFRATALNQLHSSKHPIPVTDKSYWSTYYSVFDFASEVPTLIPISELRKAIRDRPENVENLLRVLILKLDSLIQSQSTRKILQEREWNGLGGDDGSGPQNVSNISSSLKSQIKSFSLKVPTSIYNGAVEIAGVRSNPNVPRGPIREILNCIRVLTRLIPLLMEEPMFKDSITSPGARRPLNSDSDWRKSNGRAYWVNRLFWGVESDSNKESQQPVTVRMTGSRIEPQFVIEEEEEEEDPEKLPPSSGTHPSPQPPPVQHQSDPNQIHRKPLLVTLLESVLDILFLPGLCVPVSPRGSTIARYPVWTAGIGSSQLPPDHSHSHNSAKVEVLRLLLVILSKPLYAPTHQYTTFSPSIKDIIGPINDQNPYQSTLSFPNPAMTYLCTKSSKQLLLSLLCSLLNTSLAPASTSFSSSTNALSSIAIGIGKMASGKIGFGSSPSLPSATSSQSQSSPTLSASGSRRTSLSSSGSSNLGGASAVAIPEGLSGWCATLLGTLLLPDPPQLPDANQSLLDKNPIEDGGTVKAVSVRSAIKETNGFRLYLSKLHRPSDLAFFIDHVLSVLIKPMNVTSQLLSADSVASHALTNSFLNYGCGLSETVLLLYLGLDCNPRLILLLISSKKVAQVMIALTFICLEQKDLPNPKIGLVRLCAITLQLISSYELKELSLIFNSKVELPVGIRAQYSVPGTLADFLIVSFCSIIFNTHQNATQSTGPEPHIETHLNTIYTPLVLTITNLSPFLKDLGRLSSTRLSQLFLFFSSPTFILREDGNVRLLYYILEAFNYLIQYQMPDNPHLIYSIIRIHQRFESLATFTLEEGLRAIRRKQKNQRLQNKAQEGPHHRSSSETVQRPSLRSQNTDGSDSSQVIGLSQTTEEREGSIRLSNDKGKGKMRERRKSSNSTLNFGGSGASGSGMTFNNGDVNVLEDEKSLLIDEENDEDDLSLKLITAQSVGRNGFVATESWVASWRDSLPLDTIQIMLSELKPKDVPAGSQSLNSNLREPAEEILTFLRSASLTGLLPPLTTLTSSQLSSKQQYNTRKFKVSSYLGWVTSLIWSLIFIRDSNSAGYLVGVNVQLFGVKHVPRRSSAGMVVELFKPFSKFNSNNNNVDNNNNSSGDNTYDGVGSSCSGSSINNGDVGRVNNNLNESGNFRIYNSNGNRSGSNLSLNAGDVVS